ncbi:hypothetical protein [Algibacillus agarilyticus]|uniref:hypothetical protein n=1 Tax=Algibacillus agarilyticus TaxID=2234133 RepID=UPI000DCF8D0B|nr:hypothetical protein [Algibacillus agarilyticus]
MINEIQAEFEYVYVIGATPKGCEVLNKFEDNESSLIDNFKAGGRILGIDILPFPREVKTNSAFVISTSYASYKQIIQQLVIIGVSLNQIFIVLKPGLCRLKTDDCCYMTLDFSEKIFHFSCLQEFLYFSSLIASERSSFLNFKNKYYFKQVPNFLKIEIAEHLTLLEPQDFDIKDFHKGYDFNQSLDAASKLKITKLFNFYRPTDETVAYCLAIMDCFSEELRQLIDKPWQISNIRVFEYTVNNQDTLFGPLLWHKDGLPSSVVKLLYYPNEINLKSGTTQLELDDGIVSLEGEPGSCLLFNSNALKHRAIIPDNSNRKTIEITLVPENASYLSLSCLAGNNATFPVIN